MTPPSLAHQWKEELTRHAPSLKVLVYDGWGTLDVPITKNKREADRLRSLSVKVGKGVTLYAEKKSGKGKGKGKASEIADNDNAGMRRGPDGELLEWPDYVHQFDVVITTYAVLRADLNVAKAPPQRPRREHVVYYNVERDRSPLVMVEWKRVVMDEVQMVGAGKAEYVVSSFDFADSLISV